MKGVHFRPKLKRKGYSKSLNIHVKCIKFTVDSFLIELEPKILNFIDGRTQ